MKWRPPAWVVIAAIVRVAAVLIHPAAPAAEEHLAARRIEQPA